MYAMKKEDYLLLQAYKAIGTPAEIINRLDHPFPDAEEGYAPLPPMTPQEKVTRIISTFPPKPGSGLLEDDEIGFPFDEGVGTVVIDDWEEK